ncbi:ABC transporter substrate-binding protein [Pradoshia sp.]
MKKRWLGLTLAMGISMILTACGSDDSSSGEGETYKVGISQYVEHPSLDEATKGFKKAIEDAGLEVKFDEQNAQGDATNNQTIATNFAGDGVDLIFANATPSALSAANATKDIPVVFTSVTDPIGAELVKDFDAPDKNVTGTTDSHPEAIPNTVKLIADMGYKKVGTVYNSGEQNSEVQVKQAEEEAKKNGLTLEKVSVATSAEVKQAAESLIGRVDAIFIVTDNTVVSALESVTSVAEAEKIPLFVGELDSVERGGFAAYGFSYYDIGYQAGEQAVQILKDDKEVKDIPVEVPGDLKLVINKSAAEKMGVDVDSIKEEAEYIE